MNRILSTLSFLVLVLLLHSCLSSSAMAQVTLYSTFGPGHSFDTTGGYLIASSGITADGLPRWVAAPFTSPFKAHLTRIELAASMATFQPFTDQLEVQLCSNVSGQPGAVLESWLVTTLPPQGSSATISVVSTSGVTLQDDKVYWVVLSAGLGGSNVNVSDSWSLNNVPSGVPLGVHDLYGTVLLSKDGSSWKDAPCCSHNQAQLPAFEVRGKAVGEVKTPPVPVCPPPLPIQVACLQSLRLTVNIVNIVGTPVTPPPGTPVEAILGFVDVNGLPIGPSLPVSLLPGQSASLDLNPSTLPALSQATGPIEIRPVVSPPPNTVGFDGLIRSSAEVFDNTLGFGTLFVLGTESLPAAPVFAPQGLAGGQTMRLHVFSTDSTPCVATLGFLDINGAPVGPTMPVNLSGGQSAALDLNSSSLNIPAGVQGRIELLPQVTLGTIVSASAPQPVACPASVQVFDNQTGRTWTYQRGSAPIILPAVL
jgi:hypothetical protein